MFPSAVWWPRCSCPLAGPWLRGEVAAPSCWRADQACSPPQGAPWSHSGLPSLALWPGPSLPSTPPGSSTGSKKGPRPTPPPSLNRMVAGQAPLTERYKARRRTDWPSGGGSGWAGNVAQGWGGAGAPWERQHEAPSLWALLCWVLVTLATRLWPLQPSKTCHRPPPWGRTSHLSPGHTFHIHIWTNWSLVSTHSQGTPLTRCTALAAGDRLVGTARCPSNATFPSPQVKSRLSHPREGAPL